MGLILYDMFFYEWFDGMNVRKQDEGKKEVHTLKFLKEFIIPPVSSFSTHQVFPSALIIGM